MSGYSQIVIVYDLLERTEVVLILAETQFLSLLLTFLQGIFLLTCYIASKNFPKCSVLCLGISL